MNLSQLEALREKALHLAFQFGLKVIAAICIWLIGGFIIQALIQMTDRALLRRSVDSTLRAYTQTALQVLLKLILGLLILGLFGVETTTFSALLAAAGVAIGVAWSGLLSNFAAGVFLVLLRPFKIGDQIAAAGVSGTVRSIGLFSTMIDNGENHRVFVPNNKLFMDNIQNFSALTHRTVTLRATLNHEFSLKRDLSQLQTLFKDLPVPNAALIQFEIAELTPQGPVLVVKYPCPLQLFSELQSEGYLRLNHFISENKLGPAAPQQ